MRLIPTSSMSTGALLYLCAFTALATAINPAPVRHSGNRLITADASPLVSNGIASQLPPQDRLIASDDRHALSSPQLVHRISSSSPFGVSDLEAASLNVKAVAHVGMNLLYDLAYSNSLVEFLIGNDTTTSIFAKAVPSHHDVEDGSAASPRRQITGMSVALVLVMIFFAVWM